MIKFDQQHRIVWIASYPRSGNAWVSTFLFALYNVFRDPNYAEVDLAKAVSFSRWDTGIDLFRKHLAGPLQLTSRRQIAEARPKVMADVLRATKGAILFKTHNSRVDDFTPLVDEKLTAGAIYLIRNPLDVAVSLAAFQSVPVEKTILDMERKDFLQAPDPSSVYSLIGSWTGNVRSWIDRKDESTLTVRYEDLLDNPQATFGSIAAHMLMRPTPEQLAKAVAATAFDKLQAIERNSNSGAQAAQMPTFFRAGTAGQWRTALSPQHIDRVVAAHGKLMEQFGYLP